MILYSRPSCRYCHVVKDYFDKWGVEYEVRNVEEATNYNEWTQYGQMLPTVVNGDDFVVGFKLGKIRELAGA